MERKHGKTLLEVGKRAKYKEYKLLGFKFKTFRTECGREVAFPSTLEPSKVTNLERE